MANREGWVEVNREWVVGWMEKIVAVEKKKSMEIKGEKSNEDKKYP